MPPNPTTTSKVAAELAHLREAHVQAFAAESRLRHALVDARDAGATYDQISAQLAVDASADDLKRMRGGTLRRVAAARRRLGRQ